jgi:peroxiredoxin
MLGATVAAVEVGQPAPDFSLTSTSGENVSLSQFKGKKHVLVQFYSVDFNPT